jgi:hypothetical protein
VARERSFTAAAAKLNVSQSAKLAPLLRQYPDIKVEMIVLLACIRIWIKFVHTT